MQLDVAEKFIRWMQAFFGSELSKLQASLRGGLSIKEYQLQDTARHGLEISLNILETLDRDRDKFCSSDQVKQSLELIQKRYEDKWKVLSQNECRHKLMLGTGFLALDMELSNEAETLFHILALLEPDNVHPLLGLAYTKLSVGSAHESLAVIRDRVLTIAPGNDLGLAFLSLTYNALNMPEDALAAASAVITANRDEAAVTLAREVQDAIG
jgi:hypothetical protein